MDFSSGPALITDPNQEITKKKRIKGQSLNLYELNIDTGF